MSVGPFTFDVVVELASDMSATLVDPDGTDGVCVWGGSGGGGGGGSGGDCGWGGDGVGDCGVDDFGGSGGDGCDGSEIDSGGVAIVCGCLDEGGGGIVAAGLKSLSDSLCDTSGIDSIILFVGINEVDPLRFTSDSPLSPLPPLLLLPPLLPPLPPPSPLTLLPIFSTTLSSLTSRLFSISVSCPLSSSELESLSSETILR